MAAAKSYAAPTIVRDPERHIGEHMKVLQRTDGPWIVYDNRRAIADMGVPGPDGKQLKFESADDAEASGREMEAAFTPASPAQCWDRKSKRWVAFRKV